MHAAHGLGPFRAVAAANGSLYDIPMKTLHFIHHRSELGSLRNDAASNDPHASAKKALERWENEGGKIPELASAPEPDAFSRTKRQRGL
jgi:hypothetical protein